MERTIGKKVYIIEKTMNSDSKTVITISNLEGQKLLYVLSNNFLNYQVSEYGDNFDNETLEQKQAIMTYVDNGQKNIKLNNTLKQIGFEEKILSALYEKMYYEPDASLDLALYEVFDEIDLFSDGKGYIISLAEEKFMKEEGK